MNRDLLYLQEAAHRRGRHRRPSHDAGAAALDRAIAREGDALHRQEREAERAARRQPDTRTCPWMKIGQDPDSGLWTARCVCSWQSASHPSDVAVFDAAAIHRKQNGG